MGDRVAVLKDGILQQCDSPRRMYDREQRLRRGLHRLPAMNLFEVPVVDGGVKFGNTVHPVERDVLAKAHGGTVTLGVRPEDMDPTNGEGLPILIDVVEELGADAPTSTASSRDGRSDKPIIASTVAVPRPRATQSPSPRGGAVTSSTPRQACASRPDPTGSITTKAPTFSQGGGLLHSAVAPRPGVSCQHGIHGPADHGESPGPRPLRPPWSIPLEDWDASYLAASPRYLPARRPLRPRLGQGDRRQGDQGGHRSRGVRAAALAAQARHALGRPLHGIVGGRVDDEGNELDACLLTYPWSSRSPIARSSVSGCGPTPPASCSTRSRCSQCACLVRLLVGRRVAVEHALPARRVRSRPTSSTPRPGSCSPR